MTELQLAMPDDWHLHLRDGALLNETVPATARAFARAIVMPNLVPPVLDAEGGYGLPASASRRRAPAGSTFTPLMTLYLTDHTTAEMIHAAHAAGIAVKLYPAGATALGSGCDQPGSARAGV